MNVEMTSTLDVISTLKKGWICKLDRRYSPDVDQTSIDKRW
jgi:hypothetical protein